MIPKLTVGAAAACADLVQTASALASGVDYTPALFIDGERYQGELEPQTLSAAFGSMGV